MLLSCRHGVVFHVQKMDLKFKNLLGRSVLDGVGEVVRLGRLQFEIKRNILLIHPLVVMKDRNFWYRVERRLRTQ